MELKEQTRKYFKFNTDEPFNLFYHGIKSNGKELWFPVKDSEGSRDKMTFKNQGECVEWFKENAEALMNFKPNAKIEKSFGIKPKAVSIEDGDWGLIQQYLVAPENITKEDIRVYKSYLAHNFVDRDRQRFPISVLQSLNKTIVGKPKVYAHSWGGPGDGKYFKSSIIQTSIEETLQLIGPSPIKNIKTHLEKIQELDDSINWLVAYFYMLNDDKVLIRKIDAGLTNDSIGFRAPDIVTIKDGEAVLWYEFRNTDTMEVEALEGSFVWLGSQPGAQVRKSADDDGEDEDLLFEEFTKPYPNHHACRLNNPDKYVKIRYGKPREHEGKEYQVLIGVKENGKSEDQAYRYNKKVWTANEARQHCKDHKGSFEAAKEEKGVDEFVGLNDIENIEIRKICEEIDKKTSSQKATWTASYINTLEDNCFAVVEPTGEKDEEGRTVPKNARHLPHHAKGNGATGTGGTLDLPHFRNALARVNQVEAVTDKMTAEELRSKTEKHLVAHAKKEKEKEKSISGGKMDIKIKSLDIEKSFDVNEETVKALLEEIDSKTTVVIQEFDTLKKAICKEDEKPLEVIKLLKAMAEDDKKYKADLISETVRFGCLAELVEKDKAEDEKNFLEGLDIEKILIMKSRYMKLVNEKYQLKGQLPENIEQIIDDGKSKKKDKEIKRESDYQLD